MDLSVIANVAIGAVCGGVLSTAGAFLLVGVPIAKLQTRQEDISNALDKCKTEHADCAQVTGISVQLGDIITRLGRIETHLMAGGK
jgi:hypothetical protein